MRPTLLNGSNDQYIIFSNTAETIISKGKFATLYIAARARNKQKVVCKQLNPNFNQNKAAQLRFLIEAGITANHPGLARNIDVLSQEGNMYIIQEYIEGINIKQFIKTQRDVKKEVWQKTIVQIMLKILDALNALHETGYIHCDIKPANILLCNPNNLDKETPEIKIIDFGLAKTITGNGFYIEDNKTPFNILYSAPELILNKQNLADIRSDIYSLGLLFYEMLSGKPAFNADHPAKIIKQQLSSPIPSSSYITKQHLDVIRTATARIFINGSPAKIPPSEIEAKLIGGINKRFANCSEFSEKLQTLN
jgi:serine/threonine-protein kinase